MFITTQCLALPFDLFPIDSRPTLCSLITHGEFRLRMEMRLFYGQLEQGPVWAVEERTPSPGFTDDTSITKCFLEIEAFCIACRTSHHMKINRATLDHLALSATYLRLPLSDQIDTFFPGGAIRSSLSRESVNARKDHNLHQSTPCKKSPSEDKIHMMLDCSDKSSPFLSLPTIHCNSLHR
jgi:hypothetical protein